MPHFSDFQTFFLMLPICFAMLVPLLLSLELYSLLSLFQRLLSFKSQIYISWLGLYYKQNQLLNRAFSFKNKYYFSNKFLILVCVLTWVLGEMTLLKLFFSYVLKDKIRLFCSKCTMISHNDSLCDQLSGHLRYSEIS